MTVEVVSFPGPGEWDPDKQPFYFEFLGETTPVLDTSQGELAASTRNASGGADGTRVFEYTWTIGHLGVSQHRLSATRHGRGARTESMQAFSETSPSTSRRFWASLSDPAAHVYVYFPQSGGWRANELGATVKYLTPLPDEQSFIDKVAKDAELVQPLASAVGQLGNLAAPGVGSVVSGSARVIGALAQMKLGSVPQTEGFPWSAAKTACVWQKETMAGVAWSLPKRMFEELGGRITGGVGVIFMPARQQDADAASGAPVKPEPGQVLARAVVHRGERGVESTAAPPDRGATKDYIKLWIAPKLPSVSPQS